jgi:hypothetical protein
MNNVNVIDRFLDTFIRYIDSGFGLLAGEAPRDPFRPPLYPYAVAALTPATGDAFESGGAGRRPALLESHCGNQPRASGLAWVAALGSCDARFAILDLRARRIFDSPIHRRLPMSERLPE